MKNALDVFLAAVMAISLGVFLYGLVNYPDAPIGRCGANQFCGKGHRLHTEQEYRDFIAWQNALLFSFPFGFGASYLLARRRRRRASQHWERLRAMQRDLSPAIEERRYAAAWTDLRRREMASLAFSFLALSSWAGWVGWAAWFGRAGWAGRVPDGGFLAALLLPAFLALAAGSAVWFFFFRCPRCGYGFFARRSRDRCHYCDLRRGATFEEALAELSS